MSGPAPVSSSSCAIVRGCDQSAAERLRELVADAGFKKPVGREEGERCYRDGCSGRIAVKPVENCSCHIAPPCGACVSAPYWCPVCHWEDED